MPVIRQVLTVLAAAALLAPFVPGCAPSALVRQTDGSFPQPRRFDVAGSATLAIEDLDLVGRFTGRYFLLPGDEVRITVLDAELEDDVLLRERLFRDPAEIPLRCNTGHLQEPANGRLLPGSRLELAAGAIKVGALTARSRAADGSCPGVDLLDLRGSNRAPGTGTHDPDGDRFELATPLTVEIGGHSRSGRFAVEGRYSNRPPVARIASVAPDLYDFSDWGCPPVQAQALDGGWVWPDPPEIRANRPEGLEVEFSSVSFDPDGAGAPAPGNEGPRVDIVAEQWSHWRDGDYEHLGVGRTLPLAIYPKGPLHRVLLTVIDRSGARSQAECRFLVID